MQSSSRARTLSLSPETKSTFTNWLTTSLSAEKVEVRQAVLLDGGAVQENWRIDVSVTGGARAGVHNWVLRTDAAAVIAISLDRSTEYLVLETAYRAGVPVAEPIARCGDPGVIGAPFLIQALIPGIAQARKLVRDPNIAKWGPTVAEELARALAKIHAIAPSVGSIPSLPIPIGEPARIEVAKVVGAIDGASEPRPALQYILRWLDANVPMMSTVKCLVHGDFRTGNYLVDDHALSGILDWEFAHWGDPDEDIGWFCAKCWRFGNIACEAGGIAGRESFLDAYQAASGRRPDPQRIHYWEIMAAAKWAAIALLQGDRYRKHGEASLELALTGLMVSELELEALDGLRTYEERYGVGGGKSSR